jgi:hypothetical protein
MIAVTAVMNIQLSNIWPQFAEKSFSGYFVMDDHNLVLALFHISKGDNFTYI